MLSVHTQPTAAGKRSLWRPGVSSSLSSGSGRLTAGISSEVASTSSSHQQNAGFRQINQSSANTAEQHQQQEQQLQQQPEREATSTDAVTGKFKQFSLRVRSLESSSSSAVLRDEQNIIKSSVSVFSNSYRLISLQPGSFRDIFNSSSLCSV